MKLNKCIAKGEFLVQMQLKQENGLNFLISSASYISYILLKPLTEEASHLVPELHGKAEQRTWTFAPDMEYVVLFLSENTLK